MPTELEELVEFLHHGNTQIRQVATNALVAYSTQPSQIQIFKRNQLEPIKDLKLLIKDYAQIQKDALGVLTNLTAHNDREIIRSLCDDERFIGELCRQIVDLVNNENADSCCGLLANLTKDDELSKRLIPLERPVPPRVKVKKPSVIEVQVSTSKRVLDQLMDVFVKGANNSLNQKASYDYLSYVFADLSKHKEVREYLLAEQIYDNVQPIMKLIVFMEHGSLVRRKGVAGILKNLCFETNEHDDLMRDSDSGGVGILPYVLLPLAGPEELDDEDTADMLPELQLLGPDKKREADGDIVVMLVESLLLLTTTRQGRERLREAGTYPIIRELHKNWHGKETEIGEVREVSERFVDVLMRDEEPANDEDHKVEEVF
ncbi:Protein hgh1 [Elasticomyces elasticus]|nr:Protein hgh1 [Elasticomyces elasticus]